MECIFRALQGPLNVHCIRIKAAAVRTPDTQIPSSLRSVLRYCRHPETTLNTHSTSVGDNWRSYGHFGLNTQLVGWIIPDGVVQKKLAIFSTSWKLIAPQYLAKPKTFLRALHLRGGAEWKPKIKFRGRGPRQKYSRAGIHILHMKPIVSLQKYFHPDLPQNRESI